MLTDPKVESPVLVVAHRALSAGVPENSLAGIRRAREAGADLVELDIRRSVDGIPYLLHDRSLGRTTTGRGLLRLLPSRYLRGVRLVDGNERLPTLAAALHVLPDGLSPALHLKDQGSLVAAIRVIQAAGLEASTWLWLHGTASTRLAQRLAPAARVTLLEARATTRSEWARHLDAAQSAGAAGVSIPWPDLSPALLDEVNGRGLRSFSVAHDLEAVPVMIRHGLTGIITDHPAAIRRMLQEMGRTSGTGSSSSN